LRALLPHQIDKAVPRACRTVARPPWPRGTIRPALSSDALPVADGPGVRPPRVWYLRPDRRPAWQKTDVLDPSLPADLSASGRTARVNNRKAFW